jgi:hypothetical protein
MKKIINRFMLSLVVIGVVFFLVGQRNQYISIIDLPFNNPYVYSANFIKSISESGSEQVRLVLLKNDNNLNSNPEISGMLGFLGGSGYIFPFLNALNGKDFKIISIADYCQADRVSKVSTTYIISPAALEQISKVCPSTPIVILSSGYGLDSNEPIIRQLFFNFPYEKVLSSEFKSVKISHESIFNHDSDTSISIREWGVKEQILILSKSPSVSLKLRELKKSSRFIFSQSPSESKKAFEIFFNPKPGVFFLNEGGDILDSDFIDGTYFAPLGATEIRINFNKNNYNHHFKAYLFVMHDFKLRVSSQINPN